MKRNTKDNKKKYLIYIRYLLPIFSLLITAVMMLVPSYRFIFSGKAGELMSEVKLISNSWEQVRSVLFGTAEQTDAAIIFSRTLFTLIIVLVLLFLASFAISIWSAVVAFKYFLSDDEESAENTRRIFRVFIPNRIVLCILSSLGFSIAILPYLMKPLYAFTYSQKVSVVLEAPDALIVGGVLVLTTIVLSIVCAPIERAFGADVFEKDLDEDEVIESADDEPEENEDIDSDYKERIRHLFDNDKDK